MVQLAAIMKIDRDNLEIVARRLELCPRQSSMTTGASPLHASCTQEVRIFRSNNTTMVAGDIIFTLSKSGGLFGILLLHYSTKVSETRRESLDEARLHNSVL